MVNDSKQTWSYWWPEGGETREDARELLTDLDSSWKVANFIAEKTYEGGDGWCSNPAVLKLVDPNGREFTYDLSAEASVDIYARVRT